MAAPAENVSESPSKQLGSRQLLGPQKRRGQLIVASVSLSAWMLFLAWMAAKG
jgi:hypothetical protein